MDRLIRLLHRPNWLILSAAQLEGTLGSPLQWNIDIVGSRTPLVLSTWQVDLTAFVMQLMTHTCTPLYVFT